MMSGRYARPVLCRLCGFPAPDGGVPVSQLDKDQLSEWCLRVMNTELDQEGLEKAVFCHFCVADARFESQNLLQAERGLGLSLWKKEDSFKLERYFRENLIQPCLVQLEILSPNQIAAPSGSKRTRGQIQKHQCPPCPSSFTDKRNLLGHVSNIHTCTFRCQFCASVFKSDDERQKHTEHKHKHLKSCIYCCKTLNSHKERVLHMKINHKDEAIKCLLKNCSLYFLCMADMKEHAKKEHKKAVVECIYCEKDNFGSRGSLTTHIYKYHSEVKIKCKQKGCFLHFLSAEDRDEHFQQMHCKVDKVPVPK